MAKIYHVRLKPREAKPVLALARRGDWSFNRAAVNALALGAKAHPLMRGKRDR